LSRRRDVTVWNVASAICKESFEPHSRRFTKPDGAGEKEMHQTEPSSDEAAGTICWSGSMVHTEVQSSCNSVAPHQQLIFFGKRRTSH
jgi:hypothetical protein